MSARPSLVEKYTRTAYQEPPARLVEVNAGDVAGVEGREEYRAFVAVQGGRRTARFCVTDAKGHSHGFGYAYLVTWKFTPPDVLSITTTTHTIIIEGRGLDELERLLLDEKLRELRAFNRLHHSEPGAKEPKIDKVDVIDRFAGNA